MYIVDNPIIWNFLFCVASRSMHLNQEKAAAHFRMSIQFCPFITNYNIIKSVAIVDYSEMIICRWHNSDTQRTQQIIIFGAKI